MAIKKSELYSSLWASCDELRGGMDASQYKDYVLVMLFIKYISDKWAGQPFAPITIPEGASFKDMIALKGKTDIGDQINKKIIAPLKEANNLSDMPDFNDVNKLGDGKEMVDRLSNLITIFQKKELDFSKNRAEGDDILGDAYEYLMMHFATESGKSKGQFYTPAEVSRIMAMIIGISQDQTNANTTVYDPTCGSGSLLLRIGSAAKTKVTLYGQEKDSATSALSRMNMILHDYPSAEIKQGNTLANPLFLEDGKMKQFDYVVANPPFSDKRWSNGLSIPNDEPNNRFAGFGVPPSKNGDFAYLLHIVRSLKRNAKGAIILPHGVLFRGNAEAEIRTNLIKKGYIKGIIGLPANLFYGTGIPACIILIDKENALNRKAVFMVDASKGYIKDGNKNRLREQDIRNITDVFNAQFEVPGYSRMVSKHEIEQNEYNLNLPRYIDSQEKEDIQDIDAHLNGGIPNADVDDLQQYWKVYPNLKKSLFEEIRSGYSALKIDPSEINDSIYQHAEFTAFITEMDTLFQSWCTENIAYLKGLETNCHPKEVIASLAESLLSKYHNKPLINKYNVYQHLLSYWNEVMQDDAYIISYDGWKAETYRIEVENNKGKKVDKGWTCDLVPKDLVINRYFQAEKQALADLEAKKEALAAEIVELEEEHGAEEGLFAELDKVNKGEAQKRIKAIQKEKDADLADELEALQQYVKLHTDLTAINKEIKTTEQQLDDGLYAKYPTLTENEIKTLVVDDKWLKTMETALKGEIDQISQRLTNRIKELSDRYDTPLPTLVTETASLEATVNEHLAKMGFVWN
ncbi:type I restriction-modification system subunit M [Algoriphagus machipongonensis]|uniref:site-specific DNA-methyltransferase (adenine-specific) n=1 Tax=Algoriphagus machipongonensis TaxID=388413 RepID=A3HT79_9BACT|nr:type I restriction-modification system subunit M [Algoriphagus machipongonensis]EAZ83047.1 type I restriction-modification system, M subunit [Algoriphagus machipongonensis]